jgi:hypothetical protein
MVQAERAERMGASLFCFYGDFVTEVFIKRFS